MAAATLKGNSAEAASAPADLSPEQARALLNVQSTYIADLTPSALFADAGINQGVDDSTAVRFDDATVMAPQDGLCVGLLLKISAARILISAVSKASGITWIADITDTDVSINWVRDTSKIAKQSALTISVAGTDLQATIDGLDKYLAGDVSITLTSDNEGTLDISGFSGTGILSIYSAGFQTGTSVSVARNMTTVNMHAPKCASLTATTNINVSLQGISAITDTLTNGGNSTLFVFCSGAIAKISQSNTGNTAIQGMSPGLTINAITGDFRGFVRIDAGSLGSLPASWGRAEVSDHRASRAANTYSVAYKGLATPPAEYKTGEFWGGRPVYMQEFTKTATVTALVPTQFTNLVTGVAEIYQSGGSFKTSSNVIYSVECQAIASAKTLSTGAITGYYGYDLAISSGNLNLRIASIDACSMTMHIWVKYTKTADTPV
jgi:hypothetical protein